MKSLLHLSVLLCLFNWTVALCQEEYTGLTEDGEKVTFSLSDQTDQLSTLNVSVFPLSFDMVDSWYRFRIAADYVYSDKFNGRTDINISIPNYPNRIDVHQMISMPLRTKMKKKREKWYAVGYSEGASYMAKVPTMRKSTIEVMSGLRLYNYGGKFIFEGEPMNNTEIDYQVSDLTSFGLLLGLSRTSDKFFRFQLNSESVRAKKLAYHGSSRWYGFVSTGVYNHFTIHSTNVFGPSLTRKDFDYRVTPVIVRAGWEWKNYFGDNGTYLTMGFELGNIPFVTVRSNGGTHNSIGKMSPVFFEVRAGIGFSNKPWKK